MAVIRFKHADYLRLFYCFYFLYWGFGTVHIVKGMQEKFKYKKNYVIYKKNLIENAYNRGLWKHLENVNAYIIKFNTSTR